MTVITIATIGYGEIIDMSGNPAGRGFTIFIALFGIGTLTYILSNFTAFIVEGELNETFRQNLVISLTAKQLNPNIRVVARCHDLKNIDKLKKVGADAVVSPTFIGGLRMASEMVRPTVVSFLDIMLRDKKKNLRVEEIPVPELFAGKAIADLQLKKYPNTLLLAVRTKDDWIFNPTDDYVIKPENTLIFMSTHQERQEMERIFSI